MYVFGTVSSHTDRQASSTSAPAQTEQSDSTPAQIDETALTPEQLAMKKRAERFGIPFNPNATARPAKPTPAPKAESTVAAATSTPKEKAGAIDKTSLGLSDEVLAKRAAKFGLPEKKAAPVASAPAPSAPAAAKKAETEITP